jgi:hypothetical protein
METNKVDLDIVSSLIRAFCSVRQLVRKVSDMVCVV